MVSKVLCSSLLFVTGKRTEKSLFSNRAGSICYKISHIDSIAYTYRGIINTFQMLALGHGSCTVALVV